MRLAAYAGFGLRSFCGATIAACLTVSCSLDRSPSHLVVVSDGRDDAGVPVISTIAAARPTIAPIRPIAGEAGNGAPPPATVDAGSGAQLDSGASTSSAQTGTSGADQGSVVDAGAPKSDAPSMAPPMNPAMPALPCGGACPPDRPHCLPSGTCAACESDADCNAERPRCDPSTFSCVQCIEDLDCNDVKHPECSDHHCARCTSNLACSARLLTPICDLGEGEASDGKDGKDGQGKMKGHAGACIGLLDLLD